MKPFIKGQILISKLDAKLHAYGAEYYQKIVHADPSLNPEDYKVISPFSSMYRFFKGKFSHLDYHNAIQHISSSKMIRCVRGGQQMNVFVSSDFGVVRGFLNEARTHFYFKVDRFGFGYECFKAKVWITEDYQVLGSGIWYLFPCGNLEKTHTYGGVPHE